MMIKVEVEQYTHTHFIKTFGNEMQSIYHLDCLTLAMTHTHTHSSYAGEKKKIKMRTDRWTTACVCVWRHQW